MTTRFTHTKSQTPSKTRSRVKFGPQKPADEAPKAGSRFRSHRAKAVAPKQEESPVNPVAIQRATRIALVRAKGEKGLSAREAHKTLVVLTPAIKVAFQISGLNADDPLVVNTFLHNLKDVLQHPERAKPVRSAGRRIIIAGSSEEKEWNAKYASSQTNRLLPAESVEADTPRATPSHSIKTLMAQAKARGNLEIAVILNGEDMLTLSEASETAGISTRTLNTMRQKGEVIAISKPRLQRGFRYPRWQFEHAVIERIPRILDALKGMTAWGTYLFFVTPSPALSGDTPLEALRQGKEPEVLRLAVAAEAGEQQGT